MSGFTFIVWLVFLVSLLPAWLAFAVVSGFEPGLAIWAAVLVFGFAFTQILDWLVTFDTKSGGK